MVELQAGPFTLHYENGFLRYILHVKTEVIRMIYFALRDENWTTLQLIIENEKIVKEKNSFRIEYDCWNKKENETIFKWKVHLEGNPDGSITFEVNGEALTDVLKNRAGMCILHPIKETPGQPVEITHPDNSISKSTFPDHISPVNPFKNIRSMRWKQSDIWFTLDFEGDIFETEDQRNWTDASFKTFCTPLALPAPVRLPEGTCVNQKIRFSAGPEIPNIITSKNELTHIKTDHSKFPLPAIGLGAQSEKTMLTTPVADAIRKLRLSHYRIDVFPLKSDWISAFSADCVAALSLGLELEVVLHLSPNYQGETEQFMGLCNQNRLKIKYLLLLQEDSPSTSQPVIDIVNKIKSALPGTSIGTGTHFNFNELNQNRFNPGSVDFISYAIHPQEHAFDNKSIIETLEAQTDTAINAGMIYKGFPVHVSPVTLKKRFNPYTKEASGKIQNVEQRTDSRQLTPFCAAWTLGSIKHLTEGGASSVTYFQVSGNQGIVDAQGKPFPVYDSFGILADLPKEILKTQSSAPLLVEAMQFSSGDLLIWNYTDSKQTVHVDGQKKDLHLAPYEVKNMTIES